MQVLMCEVNNDNSQAKDVLLLSERLENETHMRCLPPVVYILTLNADLVRSSHVLSTADRLMRSPRQSPVRVAGWGRTRRTRCFGVEHRSLKTRDKAMDTTTFHSGAHVSTRFTSIQLFYTLDCIVPSQV